MLIQLFPARQTQSLTLMKKPVRLIQINGEPYAWQARTHEDESGLPYTKVKIWDAAKKLIHEITLDRERTIIPRQIVGFIQHNQQIL
jgi:hypothetical protein